MDDLQELEWQALEAARRRDKMIDDELAALDAAKEEIEKPRTRGWFADVGSSFWRGILKAGKATVEGLDSLTVYTGDVRYSSEAGFSYYTPSEARAMRANNVTPPVAGMETVDKAINYLGAPETKTGAVTEGLSQWLTGFLPINRAAKGMEFLSTWGKAGDAVRGLTASAASPPSSSTGRKATLPT